MRNFSDSLPTTSGSIMPESYGIHTFWTSLAASGPGSAPPPFSLGMYTSSEASGIAHGSDSSAMNMSELTSVTVNARVPLLTTENS